MRREKQVETKGRYGEKGKDRVEEEEGKRKGGRQWERDKRRETEGVAQNGQEK